MGKNGLEKALRNKKLGFPAKTDFSPHVLRVRTLIVQMQALPVRSCATRRYITFCSENIFPSGFLLLIAQTALYTTKPVLLLNFQFS